MPVYLGPYNDPLDVTGVHHWNDPHAPDCRNAAISVAKSGGTLSINVAVQNSDASDSLGNVITLYGAFRTRLFNKPADVDLFITRSVFGAAVPPLLATPWLNQTIPGRTSLGDKPWRPSTGTIIWTPSTSPPPPPPIFVIVLTVQSVIPANATQHPLVAVWVGP
jgi:hypothetical protein